MGVKALEVDGLAKCYGDRHAVRDVSFSILPGEIFGLLGPNGAGKTTTIGMIASVISPSGGRIRLGGSEAGAGGDDTLWKSKLGLVPQRVALYPSLSAEENLVFFGRMYGLRGQELRERVERLLELAGLSSRGGETVAHYSGGMKRRLNLVCGLVHRPELLLLDEPTVGVDPQSRERIFEALEELASEGLALLLTTHYLEEAERLCHRLAIMDEGRLVAEGTAEALKAMAGTEILQFELEKEPGPALSQALAELGVSVNEAKVHQMSGEAIEAMLPDLLAHVSADGNVVKELSMHRPNLGDAFLRLTGKELRD